MAKAFRTRRLGSLDNPSPATKGHDECVERKRVYASASIGIWKQRPLHNDLPRLVVWIWLTR